MRRLGAWVAAGLLTAASLGGPMLGSLRADPGAQRGPVAAAAADPGDDVEADESTAQDAEDGDRGRPPPWASSVARGQHHKHGHDAWKRLTPAQREDLMTRLAREHTVGMKAYRACRSESRTDCEKPLPPGLAKRQ